MPKHIFALCTLAALWAVGASSLHAETMYAISYEGNTLDADLFSFDSATPSVITTPQRITGLLLVDVLRDIAIRPADGQLYGISGGDIYRIDPNTAAATLVFSNLGLGYGPASIGFNPVTGQLRVISTQGEEQARSYRVNMDTGAVVRDGISPTQPRGLGYTNNYAGASTTTLYALGGGSLDIDDPENQSRFTTVGLLGVPGGSSALSSLDISGLTGTAYASFALFNGTPRANSQLYTVDLNTGAGTLVGPMGNGTPLFVAAIAAPVGPSQVAPVPEPASWGLLGAGLLLGGTFWRFRPRNGLCR